jgi:nitroimidazol reductase NimA-like FMN-containing flavoprotein (pyridoxamine 5'-phosphate oxidase superfamily)
VEVVPHEFTTQFESVIATGVARVVEADEERRMALRLILQKYASEHLEEGLRAIERSIARTAIIAIDVDSFSGKTKMMR